MVSFSDKRRITWCCNRAAEKDKLLAEAMARLRRRREERTVLLEKEQKRIVDYLFHLIAHQLAGKYLLFSQMHSSHGSILGTKQSSEFMWLGLRTVVKCSWTLSFQEWMIGKEHLFQNLALGA